MTSLLSSTTFLRPSLSLSRGLSKTLQRNSSIQAQPVINNPHLTPSESINSSSRPSQSTLRKSSTPIQIHLAHQRPAIVKRQSIGKMTATSYADITHLGTVPTPTVEGDWSVDKAVEKSFGGDNPVEGSGSPVPFIQVLERLKTTKREGWRRFGIDYCESISDHMYRMALMAMVLPAAVAARVNVDRCIKMALIHDMAELLVGDITPIDGVPKPEKSRREATTMDYLTKTLLGRFEGGIAGQQIREIWQEYEDSVTAESIVVHDLDKLELLRQMVDYEKRAGARLDLSEFAYVHKRIVTEEIRVMAMEVLEEKTAFWGKNGYQVVDGVVKDCHVMGSNGSSPKK